MPTMPRMRLRVLVLSLLAGLGAAPAAAVGGELPPPIPHGRALAALAEQESVLLGVVPGLRAERLVAGQGGWRVSSELAIWEVGGGAAGRLVPRLESLGLLRYAEPVRRRALLSHLDQGDPLLERAWHLERIGADTSEPPAGGVAITILDTGLDPEHPDFADRAGLTLLNEQTPVPFAHPDYHGTVVASTAGAAANGVGTVGVHPTAPLRVWELADLDDPTIIRALDEVADGGVVNLSIGGPGYSRALYEAVMRAVDKGALVVAAAGNSFFAGNPEIYPADYPHVLTVASVDQANRPAFYSSGHPAVDVAAPGEDIVVQDPDVPEDFARFSGTSFAAPVVSGVAAWVWAARPGLEASQVFELLRASARDVHQNGFDTRTGFGLVSIPRALAAPAPIPDPGEPNDDIDLIRSAKVLGTDEPPLTAAGRLSARISARLDAIEDPRDVYQVLVPAGRTIEVVVIPKGRVNVGLWNPQAESVTGPKRHRLALGVEPGSRKETIRYRNRSGSALTAFVDLWIPKGRGGDGASYALRVRVR